MNKRATFTGNIGFVLTAASSAVGLGNIWRFPYLAAKYGGGMFLLIYLLFVVSLGYTLMAAEQCIGRKTGKSALVAFGELNKKWKFLGFLVTLVPAVILPYYNVIGGWVVKYTVSYITGQHAVVAAEGFFESFLGDSKQLLIYQLIFTLMSTAVLLRGVQKGVEALSKFLMPILILFAIIISVYSMTIDGAMEGVKYFLLPNPKNFSFQGVLAAMGQMFFSLSLAMGIMVTYGSYIDKKSDIEKSISQIEVFDTGIAVLAGLMIIPAVFAFSGGDETALSKGPGLMFVTLPMVFESISMTTVIGSLFFLLVLFAALTSAMSVMETVVSSVCDKFNMDRKKSTVIVTIGSLLVGTLPTLGYSVLSWVKIFGFDILDFMDFLTNSILMPVCALLTCIFVGYIIGVNVISEEILLSGKFKRKKLFTVMIKYIAPVMMLLILCSSVLEGLGIISF